MKDINLLRNEVKDLKKDISLLHHQKQSTSVPSTCHIKVSFPHHAPPLPPDPDLVKSLLGCPVLCVSRVGPTSLKVKIPKECLHNAITSSRSNSHMVYVWKNRISRPNSSSHPPQTPLQFSSIESISIASWNCRGLHNSIPYILELLSRDVHILILQEHWLWPFQLDQLASIHMDYSYTAVCDSRLSPDSCLHRGCGGVAILWKKTLKVVPLSHITSDRICGIQLPLPHSHPLSILGVYMPSSDQPEEAYSSQLDLVSNILSEITTSSPVLVMGDLNCHLGHLGGPKSSDSPNSRGAKWKQVIDHHCLYVPSLSSLAQGPVHTYQCSDISTTLDYVLGNQATSVALSSCDTIEDHPLNTSDHLPLVTKLSVNLLTRPAATSDGHPPLDWHSSASDGSSTIYAQHTDALVRPFIDKDYSSIEELENDLAHVSRSLLTISASTIPHKRPRKACAHVRDSFLSSLCWRSRVAFREWKAAGRPRSGPIFEERKNCKRDVSSHLSRCRARIERDSIQKRDERFASNHPQRFRYHSPKSEGTTLLVDGSLVTDQASVLATWVDHFSTLGKSLCSSNPSLRSSQSRTALLEAQSYTESDHILDSPFSEEEIQEAILHLKKDSAGGPDLLSPQHLLYSGPLFRKWLCQLFNNTLELEAIPSAFKLGTIFPIYKGKGKDPLSTKSYRGITLTSVLAKTLEYVLLDRILPTLSDRNIPQLTQTAYQKGVSCAEAIFACQEVISKVTREGDSVYSCFYDLASAFDTVEYPVLLESMHNAGISGKAWRLIKQWYTNSQSCVRIQGSTSTPFSLHRGVRQGSVLSPTLFLLVMDPILLQLRTKSCGTSICGLYLGAFSHADDVRTLSTNLPDSREQITCMGNFATTRGLVLSAEKCEAVVSPSSPASLTTIEANGISIPITHSARCLGAMWTPNLSCSKWIEANIKKARGAFFARGCGVFHGKLNPLSSRSIVECCVMPVLLYGAESWILNNSLLQMLESFQAELAKRILKLPKFASNNVSRMALQWPSIRARVLCSKLHFLTKVMRNEDSLSSRVFRSLAASDVESLQLVRQCRFLESTFETSYTSSVLSSPDSVQIAQVKKEIIQLDFSNLLDAAATHPSQCYVQAVAASSEGSWPKVWDTALEKGTFGTTSSLAMLRLLSLSTFSDNVCPVPNCTHIVSTESPCVHFLAEHTTLQITVDQCINALTTCSDDVFTYGHALYETFRDVWSQ